MTIAERALDLMRQQRKTQAALAESVGAQKSTVNYWFNKSSDIPGEYIERVCAFLGVSPNYLITGIPDDNDLAAHDGSTGLDLAGDEAELLQIYRSLDREGRTMILATAYTQRSRLHSSGDQPAHAPGA